MNINMNSEEQEYWQKFDEAFFKDGYNLADVYLSAGFSKENLFKAQKTLYEQIDAVIDSFDARVSKQEQKIECKKGCSYCCHQTVLATPYEFFYLADFVEHKYQGNIKEYILQEAKIRMEKTSKLTTEKALNVKHPCPLLHPKIGYCRAYQARPMACRIYLSSSVKSCIDDLNAPNDDSVYPELFEMPLRAGRMMNEGFQARIRKGKMNTLQAFENPIEEGLLKALEPNAFKNWAEEKKVFRKMR